MNSRKSISAILAITLILGVVMPAGQLFASSYERYVLPAPDGGKMFVFAGPSHGPLALLLSDICSNNLIIQKVLKIVIPGIWDLVPARPAMPPTSESGENPAPAPNPLPDPVPVPAPDEEPTPEPVLPPDTEPTPEPTPEPKPDLEPKEGMTAEEELMVDLVNEERTKLGLKPLEVDISLVEIGRMKSQDMIDLNYFSHTSPTYGSPFDMMKQAGIQYRTAGENLAGASTVERAHQALMQSDGHRRNILNPAFTHIGVGIVKGGSYGMMFTQMFIGS